MASKIAIFGCGVQKAGTSSLHTYLAEHPALAASVPKETHFFDDATQDWSAPDYAALERFFPSGGEDRHRFDITPIYAFWPPALARIRAYNPAARLIFLFRDPIERAFSQWCMRRAAGQEALPFGEALLYAQGILPTLPALAPQRAQLGYVERGRYGEQVARALTLFPREQMLFLRSEDLRDHPAAVLAAISRFLAIAAFPDATPRTVNPRPPSTFGIGPTAADRALIAAELRTDLAAFALLTGLDIAHWPTLRG